MVPLRLKLMNFGVHVSTVIQFEDIGRSAILVGPTGAGKSTVIDALLCALTGECRHSLDEQIRRGQTEMAVELIFSVGGEVYRVVRGRSRKGRGSTTLDLFMQAEGEWIPIGGKDVRTTQQKLEAIVRADYELLTATSFCLQGDSGRFLKARPGERLAATRRLLGVEIYGEYGTVTRGELRLAEGRRALHLPDLQRAEEAVKRADNAGSLIPAARAELEGLHALEAQLGEMLAAKEAELAAAREAEGRRASLQKAVTAAEEELVAARAAVDRARERLAVREKEASQLTEAQAGVDALNWAKSAEQEIADLVAAARLALDEAEKAEREHAQRISAAVNREHELRLRVESEIAAVKTERQLELKKQELHLEDVRREEKAKADKRAQEERVRTLEHGRLLKDQERATERISVLNKVPCHGGGEYAACWYLADARKAKADLPNLARGLDALKAPPTEPEMDPWETSAGEQEAVRLLELARGTLSRSIPPTATAGEHGAARQALADLGVQKKADRQRAAWNEASKRWEKARRELTDLSGWPAVVATVQRAAAELPQLQTEIASAEECCDRAEARAELARAELTAIRPAAIRELVRARDDAQRALKEARGHAGECQARVSQLESTHGDLEALQLALANVAATERKVANEVEMLSILIEVYREIPVLLLETAIPAVEDAANRMMGEVGSGFRVRLETESKSKTTENVKDTLDILVTDRNGYEAPYETFSGGEKFLLDIALREALGELLSARAGIEDPPMLVIDEGWSSLDSDYLKACAEVLSSVISSGRFSLVLAVSHIQEMIDAFGTKLVVNQGVEGAQVLVVKT